MIVIAILLFSFSFAAGETHDQQEVLKLQKEVEQLKIIASNQNDLINQLKTELEDIKDFNTAKEEQNRKHVDDILKNIATVNSRLPFHNSNLQKRQQIPEEIAFYVQLNSDQTRVGNHQTIVYDNVTTNIGHAYNMVDGIFRVPVSGTYVFCWTTTNRDHSYMNTELVVNAKMVGKAMSDAMDHGDYAVASNVAVLSLSPGDEVWIQSGTWHSGVVAGDLYTTFAGWMIF